MQNIEPEEFINVDHDIVVEDTTLDISLSIDTMEDELDSEDEQVDVDKEDQCKMKH